MGIMMTGNTPTRARPLPVYRTASTCALTIGIHLNWSPDGRQEDPSVTMYLVAVFWAQCSGMFAHRFGPFRLMVAGVCASVCAGVAMSLFPCYAACLYAGRALQGMGGASLAVAVPVYVAQATGGLYRGE